VFRKSGVLRTVNGAASGSQEIKTGIQINGNSEKEIFNIVLPFDNVLFIIIMIPDPDDD
jgi:hypothetical protein